MIAKKNSRLDLERKRTALFAMGLLAAGSFTLAAFTYDSPLNMEREKQAQNSQDINYFVDEMKEKEEEKQPEKETEVETNDSQQSDPTVDAQALPDENIEKSENSDEVVKPDLGMKDLPYDYGNELPVLESMEGEVHEWVDKEAEFVGGYPEMQNFIFNKVEYPDISVEEGDEGTVFVSFIVEKDGSITNVFVEKGVSNALDREAKRIVRSFPKWSPAELDAKLVRTRIRLPITFTLAGS